MIPLGRLLIIVGIVFLVLGILLSYSGVLSALKLGRLPGDISIKREHFSLYFPITTCIILSALLTLVIYLFHK